MKHAPPVAATLLAMFLAAQLIGLFIVNSYVDIEASRKASEEAGKPVVVFENLPYGVERPEVAPDASFIFIGIAILVGTLLLLLIIKFRKVSVWKVWFLFALVMTLTVAFSSFLPKAAAAILSIIIASFRVFKPNVLMHNLSELFVYGGLAAIFVPIMSIKSAALLLILVSAYDFVAVFLSKHMISLAKFQAANNIFAGLFIPKQLSLKSAVSSIATESTKKVSLQQRQLGRKEKMAEEEKYADTGNYAVIGGGDIGFPLLFAGTVLTQFGFLRTLVIPLFASIAVFVLLSIGKKDKFYPAMPFIAVGCFLGYGVAMLV